MHLALTVQQDDRLLERHGVPDLHLAVGTLQDAAREKEHERGSLLDALEHALLCQIVGAVVVLQTQTSKARARRASERGEHGKGSEQGKGSK